MGDFDKLNHPITQFLITSFQSYGFPLMANRSRQRWLLVALFAPLFLFNQFYQQQLTVQGWQAAPTATPHAADVTLRWLMRWDQARVDLVARPLIDAFAAEHPDIHVTLENIPDSSDYYRALALQLDQGVPPDVFYPATHIAYTLDLQGQLLPLTNAGPADGLDLTTYDKDVLALYRNGDEQLYCLPADIATLVVIYNKQLFDQAGVPYPSAGWDWAAFQATAQALTSTVEQKRGSDDKASHSASTTIYGVDRFYAYWPLLLWSWSGHNLFDDPQAPTRFLLADEQSIAALQWLADLGQSGVMPAFDGPEADEGDLFLQGRAAMQITGHWRVPAYLAAGLDFDFAPLPQGKYRVNRNDGSCFAIARNSTNSAAAWTFVNWLAGPAGAGAQLLTALQQVTPARLDLQQSAAFLHPPLLTDHNIAAFLVTDAQRFGLYDPLHPMRARWQEAADDGLAALWTGERDAAKTVARLAEEATEILDNLAVTKPTATPTRAQITTATVTMTPTQSITNSPTLTLPALAFISPLALPHHYYVDPQGNDEESGLRAATPFATLQHALAVVAPGDTIHLAAGDYRENVISITGGRADAPITIMGPQAAVLRGTGAASAAFYLTHSYYTLVGFTIDGLYGDPQDKEGYTEKLLYVQGRGEKTGVTGLRVLNMNFQNAGGECLRLRYFAQHNEIAYSTFTTCGLRDFEFDDGGKNGEAIYIGTSTDQWADGKNPTAAPDESSYNWIHHNVMNTQGNECVEIKEGGYANLIEYNSCTGQLDPEAAGLGARGSGNTIRYNLVYGNVGAGVRLGGHQVNGITYGTQNGVYGNQLFDNVAGGINITVEPQAQICGNQIERNLGKVVYGDGSEPYSPTEPCK